jgi:hypothetical protein
MPAELLDPSLKPRLRGVLHQWAFAVSLVAGVGLVLETGRAAGQAIDAPGHGADLPVLSFAHDATAPWRSA